jgi:hypothetical protein
MRNMFDMKFKAVDPPVAVAVLGNRASCIESNGRSGFWNGVHIPKYLDNIRSGCNLAPIRQLMFTDIDFSRHTEQLKYILEKEGMLNDSERSVLVMNAYEGHAALWLSNMLLKNNESIMQAITDTRKEQLCRFNTYFSKYYYKINTITLAANDPLLTKACDDPEIHFNVIYYKGTGKAGDDATNCIIGWNLLQKNGIYIIDTYDNDIVNNFIRVVGEDKLLYKGDFIAIKKGS